ncbi:MAG: hypothetical protein RLY86_1171 [Pseudomonadota bacterium]
MSEARTKTGWVLGFSRFVRDWKLLNDSEPFSPDSYLEAEAANARVSRRHVDDLLRRVEKHSTLNKA